MRLRRALRAETALRFTSLAQYFAVDEAMLTTPEMERMERRCVGKELAYFIVLS